MNRTPTQKPQRARRRVGPVVALLSLLFPVTAVPAETPVSAQAQISAAIDHYLGDLQSSRYSRMEANVQPLDARLRLAPCSQPLQVEHQPRDRVGGRITFKVDCSEAGGWTVRIPANLQVFDYVVVAATSIPMGTQLSGSELTEQEMDVALQYRGYYRSIDEVRGFVTRRPIPAGQVLSPVTVNPAHLVTKGETVTILAESPGLSIRSVGVALMNGAMGDVIQVKNTKSNKVVEGRISGPGQIKVTL